MSLFTGLYKLTELPEYGHRVTVNLHEVSLDTQKISAYCDFYRYCAKKYGDPLNISIDVYKDESLQDIHESVLRYLKKNLQEIVCRYIEDHNSIPKELMLKLGINTVYRINNLPAYDGNGYPIYKNFSYRRKIARLYSLLILYDNGHLGKKDFGRRHAEFSDIVVLIDIILGTNLYYDHIYMSVVRHFPTYISSALERLKRKAAIKEEIICSGSCYDEEFEWDKQMFEVLSFPKYSGNVGRDNLIGIRDHLLGGLGEIEDVDGLYNNSKIYYNEVFRIITMIESLADEE